MNASFLFVDIAYRFLLFVRVRHLCCLPVYAALSGMPGICPPGDSCTVFMAVLRTDQTFGTIANKIHSSCTSEGFQYKIIKFWVPVLDECSLHRFFVRIFRYIYRFPVPGSIPV